MSQAFDDHNNSLLRQRCVAFRTGSIIPFNRKMTDVKVLLLALLAYWASEKLLHADAAKHVVFPKLGEIQPSGSQQNPLYSKAKLQRRYAVHEDTVPANYHHYHETGHDNHHKEDSDGDGHQHDHPQYAYKYGVHDEHTGDIKKAWEERDGDITHGGYSVVEPDGHIRIVEYTVTKHGGFQATVRREPYH